MRVAKHEIKNHIRAVAEYKYLRNLCHAVKGCDLVACDTAAQMMSHMLGRYPKNGVLIPMPSHNGKCTYTFDLAKSIGKSVGLPVYYALVGNERESIYEMRKCGEVVPDDYVQFSLNENVELPDGCVPILIDNVVSTGLTYVSALKVLPNARLYCLGVDLSVNKVWD